MESGPKRRTAPFTIIPKAVRELARDRRDSDITQVYACLAERANDDAMCWPSQKVIADDSGVSERKVRDVLKVLQDAGFLHMEHGRYRNTYTLIENPSDDVTRQILPSENDVRRQTVPVTRQSVPVHSAGFAVPLTRTQKPDPVNQNKTVRDTSPVVKAQVREPHLGGEAPKYVAWFQERTGLPRLANQGQALGAAQKLVDAGFPLSDMPGLYDYCAGFAKNGFDLPYMVKHSDSYRAKHAAGTAPASPVLDPVAFTENFHKLRRLRSRLFDNFERETYAGEDGEARYQADLVKYTALVEGGEGRA